MIKRPVLTLAILTIPKRKKSFEELIHQISSQLVDNNLDNEDNPVEVLYSIDTEKTIGEKRNDLLLEATGKYIAFIDDDDFLHKDYIKKMLEACNKNKDCVELHVQVVSNDHLNNCIFHYHLSHPLEPKKLQPDVYIYPISHLCAIKTRIAKLAKYPHKNVGEDVEYAREIHPHLKTMAFTDDVLYYYNRKK